MESTLPNTKGTIPKKKRNRVKKKYQPTNRYIYIYPCSRLRETRADPRTTIEGIADRGWTEGRKGTKQSRDKLEAARWKSSSLRADTKRWGREREKERRRKEKENGGANRFLAAFPAAASAVAAWVRSAVHGCQGGKRGGGGRRRGGGGGQERGRWLARLILSAAEIVQHPSLSLSSPFSTFHPSSSPVFFLCSHFHLSSVPPRLSLSLSRFSPRFSSSPRFISPPVTSSPSLLLSTPTGRRERGRVAKEGAGGRRGGGWYVERLAGDIIRRPRWVSEARGGWRRCTGDVHPTAKGNGGGGRRPSNEKKRRGAARYRAPDTPGKKAASRKKGAIFACVAHTPVRQRGINPWSSLAAKKEPRRSMLRFFFFFFSPPSFLLLSRLFFFDPRFLTHPVSFF